MKTSQKNLSREQIEALLVLGGWRIIGGHYANSVDNWIGLKRERVNGLSFIRTERPDYAQWVAGYDCEPEDYRDSLAIEAVDQISEITMQNLYGRIPEELL